MAALPAVSVTPVVLVVSTMSAVLLAVGVTTRVYTVVLTAVKTPLVPPVAVTLLASKPVTASAKV